MRKEQGLKQKKEVAELKEENIKLLDKLNLQNQRLNELKKENEELKELIKSARMERGMLVAKLESYEALWNEQQRAIKEKSAQIEEQVKLIETQYAENQTLGNNNATIIHRLGEQHEQIEKMKSFIHSEIDFCMYCPFTNECKNDEGTCPYAFAPEEEQKNILMDYIQKLEIAK